MDKRKYLVTLSRTEYFGTTVEVEAESEAEAIATAMDQADFGSCVDADQEVQGVEIQP